ncbi:hypothetical protein B0H13DRAFT_1861026 [Mycena leptocephala]|nr:hypothetical protein B0H13DRAFT_1861026 [Mycena leptocephala]
MSAPEGLGSVIRDAIQSAKELSAAAFIGYGVSTAAYGISIVQVYLYFRNYPKDSIFLKLTVAALCAQLSESEYNIFLTSGNSLMNAGAGPSVAHSAYYLFQGLITSTINTSSLIFYGWQIWSVSRNFVVFSLALVSCAAGSFKYPALPSVAGLYLTVHLFLFPTIVSLFGHTSRSMSTIIESTGLVCDITITTSLIYYLRSRKAAGVRSVCIAMLFILLLGKIYVNSILASLNVRTSVRGKGQLEVSTRSPLRVIEFASGPSSTPHSDSNTADSGADGGKEFQVQLGMDSMHSESNRDVGIKSFPQLYVTYYIPLVVGWAQNISSRRNQIRRLPAVRKIPKGPCAVK